MKIAWAELVCLGCNKPVLFKPWQLRQGRKFCSDECMRNHQRPTVWDGSSWDDGFVAGERMRVYRPDFPRSNSGGWALRSLVVWWLNTGEVPVLGEEVIHHINENKLDDRLENLKKLTHSEHQKIHRDSSTTLTCRGCEKVFVMPKWRVNQGRGLYCSHPCYAANKILSPKMKSHYQRGRNRG